MHIIALIWHAAPFKAARNHILQFVYIMYSFLILFLICLFNLHAGSAYYFTADKILKIIMFYCSCFFFS